MAKSHGCAGLYVWHDALDRQSREALENKDGESLPKIASPGRYQVSAELVAILQGLEVFRNGRRTSNGNHKMNPRKVHFECQECHLRVGSRRGSDGVYHVLGATLTS